VLEEQHINSSSALINTRTLKIWNTVWNWMQMWVKWTNLCFLSICFGTILNPFLFRLREVCVALISQQTWNNTPYRRSFYSGYTSCWIKSVKPEPKKRRADESSNLSRAEESQWEFKRIRVESESWAPSVLIKIWAGSTEFFENVQKSLRDHESLTLVWPGLRDLV